jgi:hypothetical protein
MLEILFIIIAFGMTGGVHLLVPRVVRRNKLPKKV